MLRALLATGASRVVAVLLAALTLAAPLTGYLHLALVEHTRCAEHGELIEGARAARPDHAALASPAPPALVFVDRSSRVEDGAVPAEHGHGHEHCLLSPFRRERASCGAALAVAPVHDVAADEHASAVASAPRTGAIALYRIAPKNSPPV